MPRTMPPPLSVTLTLLRSARGWTQKELAQATGIPSSVLSDYEKGRRSLSRAKLEKLAAALGVEPEAVDVSLFGVGFVQPEEGGEAPGFPMELDEAERRLARRAAALAARCAGERTRNEMTRFLQERKVRQARKEAAELWERLKPYSPRERRVLVEGAREFRTWALCERLCAESERAAAADAGRALDMADLALRVATRVSGDESWRSQVQGYAWAFIGNARRVGGDLSGADEAFYRSDLLWKAGRESEAKLLDEARILDLAASLRKHQGRFTEALDLHDRALALTPTSDSAYILLNMAFTLEQMGDHERAIETLRRAAPLVNGQREPRLLFALQFNLSVNLCHLGRQGEASALIPDVRELAIRLGNGLDLVRVLWLEGRVAAAQGRVESAVTALEQVRAEFGYREIAYDMALVSLELAALFLSQGQVDRVKVLAHQLTPIFRAQGVHREALAAIQLFCKAVEQEAATVEMTQQLIAYLERARHDPQLRFEA